MSEECVLLCFYLYKVFLQDGTELPEMKYSATLNDSTIDSGGSILSDSGAQIWIKKNKVIWNMPFSVFKNNHSSGVSLSVTVKWNDSSDKFITTFSIPLPHIEESIEWNKLFETVIDDYHFHFHIHAQYNYSDYSDYNQQKINDVIHLIPSNPSLRVLAEDYTLGITLNAFENPQMIESFLSSHHLSSEQYYLVASFHKEYTHRLPSFEQPSDLLSLDPIQFHCPIQFLASFFQFVEPPTLQLVNSQYHPICRFHLDFEQLGMNLACCPSDQSIHENYIQLDDTVQIRDVLDSVQSCPAVFDTFTNEDFTLQLTCSLRKVEKKHSSNIMHEHNEQTQIEVLKMKLKNMEEFQTETVRHYERELEIKQKTIFQLTQANREFEKLCLNAVSNDNSGELIRLRNENEKLKSRVAELEHRVNELKIEKDEMREIMVKFCTKE